MFKVGDKVLHPVHGAGIIEEVVTREVNGRKNDYFVMKIAYNQMTVLIPCLNTGGVGLRPILSSSEADEILSKLPAFTIDASDNWNRRYREYVANIKSGDLMKVAAVYKSLCERNREKEKGLSTGERKLLTSARQIVMSEIMLSKGLDFAEAEKLFYKTIGLNEACDE